MLSVLCAEHIWLLWFQQNIHQISRWHCSGGAYFLGEESAYQDEVEQLFQSCRGRNLISNMSNTKEVLISFRKTLKILSLYLSARSMWTESQTSIFWWFRGNKHHRASFTSWGSSERAKKSVGVLLLLLHIWTYCFCVWFSCSQRHR